MLTGSGKGSASRTILGFGADIVVNLLVVTDV
jgi:hypothetical protein